MENLSIYKWLMTKYIKRVKSLLIVIIVWLGWDCVKAHSAYVNHGNIFIDLDIGYILGAIFLFVSGVWYSYKKYPGLINIRARRGAYLKGIALIGTVGSMLLGVIIYMVTTLYIHMIQLWVHNKLVVDSFSGDIAGLISVVGLAMIIFAGSFFIGAVFYRLNKLTAICVLSIGPMLLVMSVLSYYLLQNDASMQWMFMMLWLAKPLLGGSGQLIYIVLFWLGGIALLIKAPLKAYAHDLF